MSLAAATKAGSSVLAVQGALDALESLFYDVATVYFVLMTAVAVVLLGILLLARNRATRVASMIGGALSLSTPVLLQYFTGTIGARGAIGGAAGLLAILLAVFLPSRRS